MKERYRIYFTQNGVKILRFIIHEFDGKGFVTEISGRNRLGCVYEDVKTAKFWCEFSMKDNLLKNAYESYEVEEVEQ